MVEIETIREKVSTKSCPMMSLWREYRLSIVCQADCYSLSFLVRFHRPGLTCGGKLMKYGTTTIATRFEHGKPAGPYIYLRSTSDYVKLPYHHLHILRSCSSQTNTNALQEPPPPQLIQPISESSYEKKYVPAPLMEPFSKLVPVHAPLRTRKCSPTLFSVKPLTDPLIHETLFQLYQLGLIVDTSQRYSFLL